MWKQTGIELDCNNKSSYDQWYHFVQSYRSEKGDVQLGGILNKDDQFGR